PVDHAAIRAPFDGTVFHFKDDSVTLESRGGKRWVKVSSRALGDVSYEVTRVIGGRAREGFARVSHHRARARRGLPISWLIAPKRLRYKGCSVMVTERAGVREGAVWGETCIFCHNTSPLLLSLLGPLAGPRAPAYQGVVVDRLLPPERRWAFQVTD